RFVRQARVAGARDVAGNRSRPRRRDGRHGARRARHRVRAGGKRLSGSDALPFDESRRLTGPSPFLAQPGAALETAPGIVIDDAIVETWRTRIATARRWLGWPDGAMFARRHASGASLAFAAPEDQLFCATEV